MYIFTYDRFLVTTKGTYASHAPWHSESAETPFWSKVFGHNAHALSLGQATSQNGIIIVNGEGKRKIHIINMVVCLQYCFQTEEGLSVYLERLFLVGSSQAKMWTVPWSLDTQRREESWLKLMLHMRKYMYVYIHSTCGHACVYHVYKLSQYIPPPMWDSLTSKCLRSLLHASTLATAHEFVCCKYAPKCPENKDTTKLDNYTGEYTKRILQAKEKSKLQYK